MDTTHCSPTAMVPRETTGTSAAAAAAIRSLSLNKSFASLSLSLSLSFSFSFSLSLSLSLSFLSFSTAISKSSLLLVMLILLCEVTSVSPIEEDGLLAPMSVVDGIALKGDTKEMALAYGLIIWLIAVVGVSHVRVNVSIFDTFAFITTLCLSFGSIMFSTNRVSSNKPGSVGLNTKETI